MLVRIVKMTFREESTNEFIAIFEDSKEAIRSFEGCLYLELLREKSEGAIFFTYSIWQDPQSLSNYRNSKLFEETWAKTKALFTAKAEAFSVERLYQLE